MLKFSAALLPVLFFGKEQGFGGIQAVVPALSWLHCGLRTAQRWCNKETFKNKSKN
jgi:hypothetical protein